MTRVSKAEAGRVAGPSTTVPSSTQNRLPCHGQVFVQRAAAVSTPIGQRDHLLAAPNEHDRNAAGVGLDQLVSRDVGLGRHVRPILGRMLERGRIDAHAEPVGQVTAQPSRGGHHPASSQ